jgi:nucleoside phosphorylase
MKVILFVALPSELPKELIPNGIDVHYTGVGKINAAIKATEVLKGLDPKNTIVINYGSAGSNLQKNHIYKCVKFLQGDMNAEPFAKSGETPFDELIYPDLENEITFDGNGHICCTQDQFEKNPNDNMIYDMEAYSIAKICKVNGFYFASFKYISDSGDSDDWQKNHDKGSHAFGQLLNTLIVSLLDKNGPDGGTVDTSVLGTDIEGCESSNLSWGTKPLWAADLINNYLSKKEDKKYLEIGVWFGGTFSQINADIKDSVDPDETKNPKFPVTSDEFFQKHAPNLKYKYDVIFIDGLHHTEQVDKDIYNSLKYLNEDGVIILHDCNPISEMRQRVPADFDIWEHGWNGDVWKSIYKFRKNNSHLKYKTFVIDSDEGLGVIIPNQIGKPLTVIDNPELTYEFLDDNRKDILNLITKQQFIDSEFKKIKKPKIHFITFAHGVHRSNGYVFGETQKMLVDSIQSKTNYEVVFHTHNLETMKVQPWFYKVKNYPKTFTDEWWKRDGYLCAYKVYLTKQVLDIADEGDLVYYTDSSAYHRDPFTENLDRFFSYVEHNGHVCGAVATDCRHNSFGCCDNTQIWNLVYPNINIDFESTLEKMHIVASWFCFQKNKESIAFVDEWAKWFEYEFDGLPLARYHHTVDQSIFNMLVYKYGFKVFFDERNAHEDNKNHNAVHKTLNMEENNNLENLKKWFYNPNDL